MFKDIKEPFNFSKSDKQLLKQNKIYYELTNNKDPKGDVVKFRVEKFEIGGNQIIKSFNT